ncbi:MAG: mannitol dehydrogenase family protein, partial [Pseudomonadota bacterium]
GEVLAVPTIAECMADPEISQLFSRVQQTEIVPHVQAVPDMTPDGYVTLILQRFANARIVDTVRRVAFDGSSRHTGFLLPTIRDALSAGTPVAGLALVEALWARMCEGTREDGSAIEPNDPYWSELQRAAIAARRRPAAWLEQSRFYGDLADDGTFAPLFSAALAEIWDKGSRAAISTYLKQVE